MKIIIDLSVMELPATGVAKVVTGLYRAATSRDPGLDVTGIHRRPLASAVPSCIRPQRIAPFLPPSLWRRLAIPRAARRVPEPFVHFPWNGQVPSLARTTRVVTTIHDVLPLLIPGYFADEEQERSYRDARQRDIDRSSIIVTDSEFSRGEIVRHFRLKREPIVILCATDIGEHTPETGRDDPPYFLYVGGLDPRKSVDMLLRVYLELAAGGILRSNLIVTGSSRHAPASLTSLLDDGVKKGRVEHRGYVTEEELARLYAGAVALVYPSRFEGFGMPPLEAMTLGCPVVTYRSTSIPEVCGNAAYYIESGDDHSLAQALTSLERNPDLRLRLSSEGRERSTRFSWDKSAESFLRALNEISPPQK